MFFTPRGPLFDLATKIDPKKCQKTRQKWHHFLTCFLTTFLTFLTFFDIFAKLDKTWQNHQIRHDNIFEVPKKLIKVFKNLMTRFEVLQKFDDVHIRCHQICWWPHPMSSNFYKTFYDQKIFSTSDEKIFMSITTITTWSAIIVGWKICVSRSRYRAIRRALLEYVCMYRMATWFIKFS